MTAEFPGLASFAGPRVHHAGVTVSDLDTSAEFYQDLLGGSRFGPYERSGPRIDAVTGYVGAVVRQVFLTAADGSTMVELLQYVGGSADVLEPDNGTVGAVHIALTVDDLDAALARARERGYVALSDPIPASPPMTGCRVVYMLDPDRVRVELVELPRRTLA
ncbi:VOC family protein [Rhodococcus sovatensis]|uniref:VOC family protein n=1 Tax=Rhodococcus sovatensis TaxID=1805840 RepID=A0ABZ2PI92_9NOCA